ncbi:MAG: hypothetical protein M1595_01955, partial [Candidatus Thermoplasmatota archaeon]|nr:hypothetical protein [Candidatus Thermoplasmatota archaeon]
TYFLFPRKSVKKGRKKDRSIFKLGESSIPILAILGGVYMKLNHKNTFQWCKTIDPLRLYLINSIPC